MIKLLVKGKGLVVDENGVTADTSTIYNNEFLSEVNSKSSRINDTSDYVNEIFLYFFIPFLEKFTFIRNNRVKEVKIGGRLGLDSVLWFESARKKGIRFSILDKLSFYSRGFYLLFFAFIVTVIYSIGLSVYTFLKYRSNLNRNKHYKGFVVVRSPAALSKMSFLKSQDVEFFTDDMVFKSCDGLSIYEAPLLTRLLGLVLVPFYGVRDFFIVFNGSRRMLGFLLACDIAVYYIRRIPLKVNFEYYLDSLFKGRLIDLFYTGNKEDRYAILEKRICKQHGVKSICLPHGLEYAYKMPAGLVGDIFYCNSEYAKKYFVGMYKEFDNNFIFDKSVVTKMFYKNKTSSKEVRLVFFPESRGIDKNVDIIKKLKSWGLEFYIKLHVKDCLDNYLPYLSKDMLISDFDESISNNICLARKSTVLLEAVYNHSKSIAVVVDPKDKLYVEFMFPSLNDESILKVGSFDELKEILHESGVACV